MCGGGREKRRVCTSLCVFWERERKKLREREEGREKPREREAGKAGDCRGSLLERKRATTRSGWEKNREKGRNQ